jgi:hypothetical protein
MALKYLCDGCDGSGEKSNFEESGPLARIYCPACMKVIKAYAKKRDALHDTVAKTWNNGLGKIRAEFDDKIKLLDDA